MSRPSQPYLPQTHPPKLHLLLLLSSLKELNLVGLLLLSSYELFNCHVSTQRRFSHSPEPRSSLGACSLVEERLMLATELLVGSSYASSTGDFNEKPCGYLTVKLKVVASYCCQEVPLS